MSYYRIEIDFPEAPWSAPAHPIVYFTKERKCKTAKGMDRQMNRVTNQACDRWRQYNFKRLEVRRVPATEVDTFYR